MGEERFKKQSNLLPIGRLNQGPILSIAPVKNKHASRSSEASEWSHRSASVPSPASSVETPVRSNVTSYHDNTSTKIGHDLNSSRPVSEVTRISQSSVSSSGYENSALSASQQLSDRVITQASTRSRSLGRSEKLSAEMFEDIKPQPISQSEADLFDYTEQSQNPAFINKYPGSALSGQSLRIKSVGSQKMTVKSGLTSDINRVTSSETLPVSLLTKTRRSSSLTNLSQFKLDKENELRPNRKERPSSEIVRIEVEAVESDNRINKDSKSHSHFYNPHPINIPIFPGFGRSRFSASRTSSAHHESFSLKSGWSFKSDDGQLSVSKCMK